MSRRQWFALDTNVFDSDLGVDLRDAFGPVGLCMWVGFLAACKRNNVPGKIVFSSDAECLSLLGLPAVELVNEDLDPFTLDEFWGFLGQRKQTKVTRRKRLTYVHATRWEQWQKDGKRAVEAERKARSRDESERTGDGQDEDLHDLDLDTTRPDRDNPLPPHLRAVGDDHG
jgi:hypothetical protein